MFPVIKTKQENIQELLHFILFSFFILMHHLHKYTSKLNLDWLTSVK